MIKFNDAILSFVCLFAGRFHRMPQNNDSDYADRRLRCGAATATATEAAGCGDVRRVGGASNHSASTIRRHRCVVVVVVVVGGHGPSRLYGNAPNHIVLVCMRYVSCVTGIGFLARYMFHKIFWRFSKCYLQNEYSHELRKAIS